MRETLKGLAEAIGTQSGITALARRLAARSVAIVAYHNVVHPEDAGRGDASLHLPLPDFIAQIERLARTHDIVDLRSALGEHAGPRPRAVITFDDAYRGAVELALPQLVRRGLPATVFVAPGLLGAAHTWWDALAEAGIMQGPVRDDALARHQGHHAQILAAAFGERARPALPASYGIATEAELRAQCRGGISVGSHTWDHEYLPALGEAQLTVTLLRSLDWVRSFPAEPCNWLALPYGGGTEAIGRSALALGYEGVLRVEGGLWRGTSNRAFVPRINVPSAMSVRGLELRTSGAFPRG